MLGIGAMIVRSGFRDDLRRSGTIKQSSKIAPTGKVPSDFSRMLARPPRKMNNLLPVASMFSLVQALTFNKFWDRSHVFRPPKAVSPSPTTPVPSAACVMPPTTFL
jgi:hypothetical protein